ncbi:MAG TPA: hypothetical protein VMI54_15605 [Polyangiaceae bacterium]|nr:hypothetical protein [Polyangiaceae bacterium]
MVRSKWARLVPWLRWGLVVLGLGFVAYFVSATGPRRVLAALASAGPYAPLIAGLELLAIATDVGAFASLLGADAARVAWRGWLRSSAAAYGCFALMPAGRTASEVARASMLAVQVGALRAAAAGAQLQAAALVADGMVSFACMLALRATGGDAHHLAAMLDGNAALTATSGVVLLFLIRHRRVAQRLAARFPRFFAGLAATEVRPQALGVAACAWSFLGRALLVLQYGVAVLALGGGFSLRGAATAYGVHAVAATVGVGLPGQVGVADGAYLIFADALGFAHEPAHALAVMLAIRAIQVAIALVCLALPVIVRRDPVDPNV